MKIREDLFVKYPTGLLRDLRILKLIQKFPYMGYSLYMRLNAFMMENESCEIPFESIKLLALILVSTEEDIRKVVDYCIELELYVKSADGKVFYSEGLKAQREEIEAKSKMQRAKANRRWNKEIPQESNATAMPRQCHGNAKKNEKNRQNETQTQKQTEDASTSATTAAEKPPDYSPELRELSDEIAIRFGYSSGRKFDRRVAALIHDLRPGDGFQTIPEALKKLDSAQAILAGKVTFTIGSFLDCDKFLRLYGGEYDDLYTFR